MRPAASFKSLGWTLQRRLFSKPEIGNALRSVLRNSERITFPTGERVLDRLVESEKLLDVASDCLSTTELCFINAHVFTRRAAAEPDGPRSGAVLHYDQDTNCFLPGGSGRAGEYLNCHIFLHDVGPADAPMIIYPGTQRLTRSRVSEWLRKLKMQGSLDFSPESAPPQFPAPIYACAKAGDVLFYSSLLLHRAQRFGSPSAERHLFTMTIGKMSTLPLYRRSWPYPFTDRRSTNAFLAVTTPRVRTMLGWPPVGARYYSRSVLAIIAEWYPGIDLGSYDAS